MSSDLGKDEATRQLIVGASCAMAGAARRCSPAIARIVREDEQTVRRWLKHWLAEGIAGLQDRPMPGGPAKITDAYREQLLAAVRQRPRSLGQHYSLWTLQRLADYLAELTGLRLSYETVRVALKAGGIALSRPQHTVTSPDPEYRVKKRRSSRPVTVFRPATPSTMPTSSP